MFFNQESSVSEGFSGRKRGSLCSRAQELMGLGRTFWPRPLGRSGCVMMPANWQSKVVWVRRKFKRGRAMGSEPMKAMVFMMEV